MSTAASYLPGAPNSADYWNRQMSASALFGLSPASGSKAAGATLPPTSVAGGDKAMVPWHPDSGLFWLALVGGLTVLGMVGASVEVRAFRGRAGAHVGTT